MTIFVSDEEVDKTIKEIEYLKENLIEQFLENHCLLINEQIDGYDGCYVTRRTYSEEDFEEATESANEIIFEAMKKLNIIKK